MTQPPFDMQSKYAGWRTLYSIALPAISDRTRNTRKITINRKNNIRAMPAVAAEMPVKPKTPFAG